MLHIVLRAAEFLLLSWVILMMLGLFGQLTRVGEKYAIVAVVLACTAAGVLLMLQH